MYINKFVALFGLSLASACGGGGGGGGGGSGNFPQPSDSISAQNQYDSLIGTQGFTNPANFPSTMGATNYTGVVTLQRAGAQYYGELDMDVAFLDLEFEGSMDNFNVIDFSTPTSTAVDVDGGFLLDGTLTGNNGIISNALDGFAFGTLDGIADIMSVDGNFAGSNAEGVGLIMFGGVFQGVAYGD